MTRCPTCGQELRGNPLAALAIVAAPFLMMGAVMIGMVHGFPTLGLFGPRWHPPIFRRATPEERQQLERAIRLRRIEQLKRRSARDDWKHTA